MADMWGIGEGEIPYFLYPNWSISLWHVSAYSAAIWRQYLFPLLGIGAVEFGAWKQGNSVCKLGEDRKRRRREII